MRTTIDLRDDIHARTMSIARDRRQTLSATVNELLSRVLDGDGSPARLVEDARTGRLVLSVGRVVTADDVRALEDEE